LIPSIARALTTSNQRIDAETETLLVAHSLRGEGFDASEDGTGRGTPLVPVRAIGFGAQMSTPQVDFELMQTLQAKNPAAVAVNIRGRDGGATAEISGDVATALRASQGGGDKLHALTGAAVRRLTPRECERLQGFRDDYTLIAVRGKPAADGPRYKALGNSMAVPVMAHIGRRIQLVENIINQEAA
jgi:DNA (cytosine-5)-methyltransferase 1